MGAHAGNTFVLLRNRMTQGSNVDAGGSAISVAEGLSFLADDVGKDLDSVLDATVRSPSEHLALLSTAHTVTLLPGRPRRA